MKGTPAIYRTWLLIAAGMLTSQLTAVAQQNQRISTIDGNPIDSTGAHWTLRTDYKTRTTNIQFFNAWQQLIYEEKLPGRYVRLTKRNVRLFDELLDGLAYRRLLDSRIESSDLLTTNTVQFTQSSIRRTTDLAELETPNAPGEAAFVANSAVSDHGKMVVYCTNPNRLPMAISLTDDAQETDFYRERSKVVDYTRYFDINQLPIGNYRLQIKNPQQTVSFVLTVKLKGERYSLRELR